jgi:hypothetical protein
MSSLREAVQLRLFIAVFLIAAAVFATPAPPCEKFFASLPVDSWLRRWRGPDRLQGCDDTWTPLFGVVYDKHESATTVWLPFGIVL